MRDPTADPLSGSPPKFVEDPRSSGTSTHEAFTFASPTGGRRKPDDNEQTNQAQAAGKVARPACPDGVHAAGEAGLLLRRRGGRRGRRGLLSLQGLQARSRLHGPQDKRSPRL